MPEDGNNSISTFTPRTIEASPIKIISDSSRQKREEVIPVEFGHNGNKTKELTTAQDLIDKMSPDNFKRPYVAELYELHEGFEDDGETWTKVRIIDEWVRKTMKMMQYADTVSAYKEVFNKMKTGLNLSENIDFLVQIDRLYLFTKDELPMLRILVED